MVKLSDSEWKVMSLIWDNGSMSLMELTDALLSETSWSKHTVMTFLRRLEDKGAILHEERGRTRYYYSAVNPQEVRLEETGKFLNRVFGGNVGMLMNNLVSTVRLTDEEIDALYEILDNERRNKR